MFEKTLFVGAHPDDVEITSGGLIARLVEEGRPVSVCVLTGTILRQEESLTALGLLGVHEVVMCGMPENTLFAHLEDAVVNVEQVIRDCHPTTVVTHYHADTHQDHAATYKAVVAASRKLPNVLMTKPVYPSGRPDIPFHPTLVVSLEDRHIKKKILALNEFRSQRTKYGDDQWAKATEAIAVGDAWAYGGYHGWAELFQVSRLSI